MYAAYVARTTFLHTLAFNEPLKGLAPEHLRYAMLAPTLDLSFVEEARKRFVAESAYLDDRPGALMRFLAEANLNQIIRREERNVDAGEARAELGERIGHIFNGDTFDAVRFPGGPFDVPDEVGDGRPKLIVLSYDAVSFAAQVNKLPPLVERIYTRKGADGAAYRALRNHLLFVATDDTGKAEMQRRARLRLALRALKRADRLRDLAEHQQDQVLEMEARSEQELAIAIQQAYRHVLYPSSAGMDAEASLAHTAFDIHSAADQPGVGQRHIVRALCELQKLRLPEDEPDAPVYVRDRTPLRKGQMTTLALRDEFRRDPALPMLIGDDTFIRGIRIGVERGDYVYQRRSAVRAWRPAGIRADRRTGGGADHGLRQEHRRMAAACGGGGAGRAGADTARPRHRGGKREVPCPARCGSTGAQRRRPAARGAGSPVGTSPRQEHREHRRTDAAPVRRRRCLPPAWCG